MIDAQEPGGLSALHYSVIEGDLNLARELVSGYGNGNIKTEDDNTPLHFAYL